MSSANNRLRVPFHGPRVKQRPLSPKITCTTPKIITQPILEWCSQLVPNGIPKYIEPRPSPGAWEDEVDISEPSTDHFEIDVEPADGENYDFDLTTKKNLS